MKVLMITGDRHFASPQGETPERLLLQRSAVAELKVVYWGRGAFSNVFRIRGSYDVVTVQDPLWRGLIGLFVARKVGAKLNVQVHMDLDELSFVRHNLAQIALSHADSIRVVSDRIKKQVERFGVSAKITVLPVFVALEQFRSLLRRDHSGKNIVWIGRFEKEKNPLQAIEVLRSVLSSVPDARLIMVGEGSLRDALAAVSKDLPVEGITAGWQDIKPHLEVADVVLCTSLHESWGASIIEALAAGVPVVAPDVGVAREAGARVVPREELSRAVVEVLTNGETGELQIQTLDSSEWVKAWRDSLI